MLSLYRIHESILEIIVQFALLHVYVYRHNVDIRILYLYKY